MRSLAIVICPAGWWYGDTSEEKLDAVLQALEGGRPAPGHLICP